MKGGGERENSEQKMPFVDGKLISLLSSEFLTYMNFTVIF